MLCLINLVYPKLKMHHVYYRPGPRNEKDKGYFIIMVNKPYEPEYTIIKLSFIIVNLQFPTYYSRLYFISPII